jgi:peptidoglycan/xylan/chitin deacetylase (PgdA/CDA1 family)
MRRREFIGALGGAAVVAAPFRAAAQIPQKTHIVSLSFDDGFKKSFIRIAQIYEKFGLSGCFNIIANAHVPGNNVRDDYMKQELFGDFGLWNELQDRGHEIMPHGFEHEHLARLPLPQAKDLITRCLDVFSKELRGFDARKALFNFPYNQSSPAIEEWLPTVVMAFRTTGGVINPLPTRKTVKVTTGGWGPDSAEKDVDDNIAKLLAQPQGWMVYNLHGLNEEGWGPIRPEYLERLLARLREIDSVRVIPPCRAIMQSN